jgi:bifunctional non-homologous end joining protein LigD
VGSTPFFQSLVLNEHYDEDGAIVYREPCRVGCEGIVSKQLGSPYRSGRSAHWVKAADCGQYR